MSNTDWATLDKNDLRADIQEARDSMSDEVRRWLLSEVEESGADHDAIRWTLAAIVRQRRECRETDHPLRLAKGILGQQQDRSVARSARVMRKRQNV